MGHLLDTVQIRQDFVLVDLEQQVQSLDGDVDVHLRYLLVLSLNVGDVRLQPVLDDFLQILQEQLAAFVIRVHDDRDLDESFENVDH